MFLWFFVGHNKSQDCCSLHIVFLWEMVYMVSCKICSSLLWTEQFHYMENTLFLYTQCCNDSFGFEKFHSKKMNLITSKFMALIEFWPFLYHKQNISVQLGLFTLNVFCYLLNNFWITESIMLFEQVVRNFTRSYAL